MPIMSKVIQFTSMFLGVNSPHEIITETLGFHVAESPAEVLPCDVNGLYHVIHQSFAMEMTGGSKLQLTTFVCNVKG